MPKIGLTNSAGTTPIATIRIAEMICGAIMLCVTSIAFSACLLRGEPRKMTPNALVKQNTANPPIRVSPIMLNSNRIDCEKPAPCMVLIIPKYIRYSEMNPLNGGSPQIAMEPNKNRRAV